MYVALIVVLLVLCGCSSLVSRCEAEVKSFRLGEQAQVDEKSFPIGAYTQNREAARLLLDRAVIRLQQGDPKGSLTDMCTAIDAIDYYRSTLAQETALQVIVDDEQSAYIAKRYEAIFARLYAAFACYALERPDDAFIFLKQALAQEDLRNELENKRERSPLLSYLMALHLEKQKDFSQARLFYKRAYDACPLPFIQQDLERVEAQTTTPKATVLFIVHQGLIPEKISITAPISIVSAAAVEVLLAALNIPPAISSLTGVELPAFPERNRGGRSYNVHINHKPYASERIEDIFARAKKELDEETPSLAARAAARQLIRRAAVGAMREKNPIAGDIADIFAFAANAATRADARMWKTLPQEIHIFRIDLPPGTYLLGNASVTLTAGQLYVQQLFHPHK